MKNLLDNLPLKLVSLFLALLLWLSIAGQKTSEIMVQVPVELRNFPPELELVGDPVSSVEVRLRATPGMIKHLSSVDVSAFVDVRDVGEGEHILHLTPESVLVPFGVRVIKVSPATLTLHFERTGQKLVEVHPRVAGRPAPGFEVGPISSDPPQVPVSGPRSRLAELDGAFTEPVSVDGRQASFSETVNVGLDDPMIRVEGRPRAQVSVTIREVQEKRTLEALPVSVRNGAGSPRPDKVRVVVSGPVSVLAHLTPGDVRPWVDASGPEAARVSVDLPPGLAGLTVELVEPERVALRMRARP